MKIDSMLEEKIVNEPPVIRILYVITMSIIGGAQVHLLQLIDELAEYIEPHVVVGETGWLYDELIKRNISVYCIESLVREISLLDDVRATAGIAKIINRIKPDIVHCHSSKAGIVGRIAAKWCGVPVLFTAHGWAFTEGVTEWKRKMYKAIERVATSWSEKILCVSEYDRNLALTVMPKQADRLLLVHNGIGSLPILKHRELNGPIRFIMVARFMEPKDQETVLRAVAQLKNEQIRFSMTFVGDGEKLEAAKKNATDLELNKYVTFLGARGDVERILAEQDVFLLISKWEGLPISILEALRAGMPVIASNVGGIPETVENGFNGFLVERQNQQALVDCMKRFVADPNLIEKMGGNGRRKFEAEFTSAQMAKIVLTIYKNIVKRL
ncbi:glycosyltransferase family 4 protein [Azotosporobacter soli]|uniref:glycosyltransferase family 4 protein n=1 Tax=Azotosporobacter soli TaxID=3055040 RepID=UPI0031FF21EB